MARRKRSRRSPKLARKAAGWRSAATRFERKALTATDSKAAELKLRANFYRNRARNLELLQNRASQENSSRLKGQLGQFSRTGDLEQLERMTSELLTHRRRQAAGKIAASKRAKTRARAMELTNDATRILRGAPNPSPGQFETTAPRQLAAPALVVPEHQNFFRGRTLANYIKHRPGIVRVLEWERFGRAVDDRRARVSKKATREILKEAGILKTAKNPDGLTVDQAREMFDAAEGPGVRVTFEVAKPSL